MRLTINIYAAFKFRESAKIKIYSGYGSKLNYFKARNFGNGLRLVSIQLVDR